MEIRLLDKNEPMLHIPHSFCLLRDNWDDFGFKTSFALYYFDGSRQEHWLGPLKIGVHNMKKHSRIFDLMPQEFEQLDDTFFSVGQGEEFYQNVSGLGSELCAALLTALRDMAYAPEILDRYQDEEVMKHSLLRSISPFAIRRQLHRIAHGGALLTRYDFTYTAAPPPYETELPPMELSFHVLPDSNPPTNIHVLIGRNGTGKTTLLRNMIRSILFEENDRGTFGYTREGRRAGAAQFANVLCVAFSPFDDLSIPDTARPMLPYAYIGLHNQNGPLLTTIENQFMDAFRECMASEQKRRLWLEAIDTLSCDPTFGEEYIPAYAEMMLEGADEDFPCNAEKLVREAFSRLSSGHKVVLLIITCCVHRIEEQSIVFMDEPENHLHPPLLSALIRALSGLLTARNGVAVLSTHSPVVLQEVPRSCVWKFHRYDSQLQAQRLQIESFGAGIGALTSEIFGLEVTNSGFHRLLADAVNRGGDYDSIIQTFGGQLGNEADIHLRTLLALRNGGETE